MKVDLPYLVQDPSFAHDGVDDDAVLATPLGWIRVDDDGGFEDGPAGSRIRVVDRHPVSPSPPVAFRHRGVGTTVSDYAVADFTADSGRDAFSDPAFIRVNAFATCLKAIQFVEHHLGRTVPWAFDAHRLTLVARAGVMRNAFYERDTESIEFYEWPTTPTPGTATRTGYAALSYDIITHETVHALLDGLAPDLYDAVHPESVALHESIADLVATFAGLLDEMVLFSLFNISSSTIDIGERLGRLAEEMGASVRGNAAERYLRSAQNELTMRDVDMDDAHDLSQVMTGAVYTTFLQYVDESSAGGTDWLSTGEKKFSQVGTRFVRAAVRALDHLPPGEATFADYARALVAAWPAPGRAKFADRFGAALTSRGVVTDPAEIAQAPADLTIPVAAGTEPESWFDQHRATLSIPEDADLDVLPVTVSRRSTRATPKPEDPTLHAFRARWAVEEAHLIDDALPERWAITHGITVALDGRSGAVVSALRSGGGPAAPGLRASRLAAWHDAGRLGIGDTRSAVIDLRTDGGIGRIHGSARLLHVAAPG